MSENLFHQLLYKDVKKNFGMRILDYEKRQVRFINLNTGWGGHIELPSEATMLRIFFQRDEREALIEHLFPNTQKPLPADDQATAIPEIGVEFQMRLVNGKPKVFRKNL